MTHDAQRRTVIATTMGEDQTRVWSRLVRLSMQSGRHSWAANLVFSLLFALVHWRETGRMAALLWCAAFALVLLGRGLFARRALVADGPVLPATTVYAGFAVAEGAAWALALLSFSVADPAGFMLQFALTLGATAGLLLPFGALPRLWFAGALPLAIAQGLVVVAAPVANADLLTIVWLAVLGLGAFASFLLHGEIEGTTLLQIGSERAAAAQQQVLQQLNDSREQLRLALEAIDAGLAETNLRTGERFFSVRFTEMLGYVDRAAFLRDFRLANALHPDDRERVLAARQAHQEKGRSFRREFRIRNARGEYLWVEGRGESLRDAGGQASRFVMSIVDITKRREAEARLVASERRYRALVDATPSLIWTCDRAGKITLVSGRACKQIYGYERRHVLGRHVMAFNAPEFTPRLFRRRFLPVFRGRPVFDVEAVQLTHDGSTVHVTVSAIPTFGADGELESVLGVCTDITALKRREGELAVALRNQQVIFDAAGEGIAFVRAGRIERSNGALAKMLGVSHAWLEGRPAVELLADRADWPRIVETTRAAAGRGESANQEVLLRRAEDSAGARGVWSQLTARLVGNDGESEAIILVLTDITPLKQREEMAWHQANHDELTGLPNRRLLVENARRLLSVARRRDRRAALMVLDLDGFKAVNDALGHAYGDAMLRRLSVRMSMALREYDLIARTGGDEFVILLPEIDSADIARAVAEKLVVAAREEVALGDRLTHLGASVGIAMFPADGQDFDSLMRRADEAMYASKQAGKGRCMFAQPMLAAPVIPAASPGLRPH
jgi:diguanylate cyclase (GGDEF)-like protein/PAS domain S-box-containing protein